MRSGAAIVLVLQAVLVVRTVQARSTELKGLACYTCTADNRNSMPICDAAFWKVTTPEERRDKEELCRKKQSSFCIKKVQEFPGYTKTTRGCVGDKDMDGHKLRVGCQTLHPDPETEDLTGDERAHTAIVCFCKTSFCNGARRATKLNFALVVVPAAAALAVPWLF